MKFRELKIEEFEKFASKAPGANFMQSREMYERFVKNGREAYLVGVENGSRIVCAGIVMRMGVRFGKKVFGVAMGPLMNFAAKNWREILEEFTSGVSEFLRVRGGMVLEIAPHATVAILNYEGEMMREVFSEIRGVLLGLGYKNVGEVGQIKYEYVLNLTGRSEEEIFASFRKDTRTRIRQAASRYGVRVRDLKYEELAVMEGMADEAAAVHGFSEHDLAYYQGMYKAFGDKVRFVVAEVPIEVAEGGVSRLDLYDGKLSGKMVPISAVMYMMYGPEVLSLFSGVTRKYRNVGGCSHLIRWELIREAIAQGFLRYDFYGVQPAVRDGVFEFKAGFRGEIEELVGTHVLPLSLAGRAYVARMKYQEVGKF